MEITMWTVNVLIILFFNT